MLDAKHVIFVIYDIYDAITLWHTLYDLLYVCQYGCQKKHYDLKNAANCHNLPMKLFLWLKIEISSMLIFPLYFSEYPLYIIDCLGRLYFIRKYINLFNYFIFYVLSSGNRELCDTRHFLDYEPPYPYDKWGNN